MSPRGSRLDHDRTLLSGDCRLPARFPLIIDDVGRVRADFIDVGLAPFVRGRYSEAPHRADGLVGVHIVETLEVRRIEGVSGLEKTDISQTSPGASPFCFGGASRTKAANRESPS